MYLGSWQIDDLLTFPANSHSGSGIAVDADAVPVYRVYEDETGTSILTGSMAKLDDANTTGFYTEQITLSAANGFEAGKTYTIYLSALISANLSTISHTFQVAMSSLSALESKIDDVLVDTGTTLPAQITGMDGKLDIVDIIADAILARVNSSQLSFDISDTLLNRHIEGLSSGTVTVTQVLQVLRNRVTLINGVMTVYESDGSTVSWTANVTSGAGGTTEISPN